jgi:hypothetical protein
LARRWRTASARYVETLLYGMKGSDPVMLTGPELELLAIALLSALPVIARASRIDPRSWCEQNDVLR